jgi:ribosomal protein L15E
VHDDLLSCERRVEVRDDPHLPRIADPERLGRRSVFASRAERALVELRLRRLVERGARCAGTATARGRDCNPPARQLVSSKIQ